MAAKASKASTKGSKARAVRRPTAGVLYNVLLFASASLVLSVPYYVFYTHLDSYLDVSLDALTAAVWDPVRINCTACKECPDAPHITAVPEEGSTAINRRAFYRCENLKTVVIAEGVTDIGEAAFLRSRLVSVDIPDTVTEISTKAFAECDKLESVVIPGSVETLKAEAFLENVGLKTVVLSEGVKHIGKGAFQSCIFLNNVTLPSTLLLIGDRVFNGCYNLPHIKLPSQLLQIGSWAFHNNKHLQAVDIPPKVINIMDYAFYDCTGLSSVRIPESVNHIGKEVFSGTDCCNHGNAGCLFQPGSHVRHCTTNPCKAAGVVDHRGDCDCFAGFSGEHCQHSSHVEITEEVILALAVGGGLSLVALLVAIALSPKISSLTPPRPPQPQAQASGKDD